MKEKNRMAADFPTGELLQRETPYYLYDMEMLKDTLDVINREAADKNFLVEYAIKANANPELLKMIASAGLGADVVSGGEILAALDAGFKPENITFAGVGKTDKEIRLALEKGIGCLNVESAAEAVVIAGIAKEMGKTASVAIRVNPNIDAHTHHYITTGLAENKFGIALQHLDELALKIAGDENLRLEGLHFHIGSQVTITEPFKILCEKINGLQEHFAGLGITFHTINVGGGLGIDYDDPDSNPIPDFHDYFATFRKYLNLAPSQVLHFELGRSVVAQCGSLITRVLYVKEGVDKKFCIVDAGFTELIRPALYQAHHLIQNISSPDGKKEIYDVVGPICESSDVFATEESLPEVKRGDLLALRSAGAYGEVMSSHYNCRRLNDPFYWK